MSEPKSRKASNKTVVSLVTGCISGAIECVTVWPMEYIKTQLQLQKVVAGGLGVTLVGSVPKAGIRFGGNAYFKKLLAGPDGKLNMAQQFLAGMGAGTFEAVFAVTPMETIKTKCIQTNQRLVPGVASILRDSGIKGLYQGVVATVLKQASNQGLRFMFFNKYKDILTHNGEKGKLSPISSLIGGMLAGCFSTIGNNPFDVVKTRMQGLQAAQYKSTLHCGITIFQEEGLRGLYRGVVPRMGRVVPGQGVIFMSFETIQEFVEDAMYGKK